MFATYRYLPDVEEGKLSNSVVEIDINKPMSEVIPKPSCRCQR